MAAPVEKGGHTNVAPSSRLIKTDAGTESQSKTTAREVKKAESAMEFERVFARYLVGEMTKDTFKSDDKNGMAGADSDFYKDMIVDALSNQLAREKRLGFADMVMQFWNRNEGNYDK